MPNIRFIALLIIPLLVACGALRSQLVTAAAPVAFQSERIEVTTVGSGQDVVLIPGLSSSPQVWESTIEAMPGYRYHLVQINGFAGAPAKSNATGPVVASAAEEIARYITDQGLNRPAVVGHSLGGTMAMMVASRHPDSVSKIMVIDMLPFPGAMYGPVVTAENVAPIAAQLKTGIIDAPAESREATTQQTIDGMVRTEALRAGPVTHALDSDPRVSGQAMYDLITTDLRRELKVITAPMTVLWVHPPTAPISGEQMAELYRFSYANVRGVTLTQIPESYHFIMFDEPERFQRELNDFLREDRDE